MAIVWSVLFGSSETSAVLCGENAPFLACSVPFSLLAMKLRSLRVLASLLNAAAMSPPTRTELSPSVLAGKGSGPVSVSSLAMTASGKPPLLATKVACLNR